MLVVGLLMAGSVTACGQGTEPSFGNTSKGNAMSITYQATSRKARWIVGAQVVLDLRIENQGAGVFETPDPAFRNSPQPVFEVTPPQGAAAVTVRPNVRATEWDEGRDVTMLSIAPGETWEGDLQLSTLLPLTTPGTYQLRSWLESDAGNIEAKASSFEIVAAAVRDLAAETSVDPDGLRVTECVQLLDGGMVVSTLLAEEDPGNAELLPLDRIERGSADADAETLLAPYSNFTVGLSEVRWTFAVRAGVVTAGCNVGPGRAPLFEGKPADRVFQPLGTGAGAVVLAMYGKELRLTTVTASDSGATAGPVRVADTFDRAPVGGAVTLSPAKNGDRILVVLVWAVEHDTRIDFLTVDASGKTVARNETLLDGWQPTGAVGTGWSRSGELRCSFGAKSMYVAGEVRVFECHLLPDLTMPEEPVPSAGLKVGETGADLHIAYFQNAEGRLIRAVLARLGGGKSLVVELDGSLRSPRAAVPDQGPIAILPGESLWYVAWPTKEGFSIEPL